MLYYKSFRDMTPRTLVGSYQCCGGTLWATILKMEAEIPSEIEVPFHQTTRASRTYEIAFFTQPVPACKGFHDFFTVPPDEC